MFAAEARQVLKGSDEGRVVWGLFRSAVAVERTVFVAVARGACC